MGRGYALVAQYPISRGQIIYTEKALESAQIPMYDEDIMHTNDETKHKTSDILENSKEPCISYEIKGCQHCFRSMEPASSLCTQSVTHNVTIHDDKRNESENENAKEHKAFDLPMTHLWPVPEYTMAQSKTKSQKESLKTHSNTFGIICSDCGAIFCSRTCHEAHNKRMGNCCTCTNAILDVYNVSKGKKSNKSTSNFNTEDRLDENTDVVNPVFILAARIFCSAVHNHRKQYLSNSEFNNQFNEQYGNQVDIKMDEGSYPFFHMCGDESDISKLELGIRRITYRNDFYQVNEKKQDGGNHVPHESNYFTMEHVYLSLVNNVFALTKMEQKYFSLSYFHKLVATIARNAIGVTTQSPFKAYYSALLRNCPGGRGSKQHLANMKQVALTLGAKDGKLNKQMDRDIENRVRKKMDILFVSASLMCVFVN